MAASTIATSTAMPPSNPPRPSSPFFRLPRELRDTIYHHVFQHHRFLPASLTPQLNMHLRYPIAAPLSPTHSVFDGSDRRPHPWMLASKIVFHEALAQFVRRAEWSCYFGRGLRHRPHITPLVSLGRALEASRARPRRLELYVDLAYHSNVLDLAAWMRDVCWDDLTLVVDAMRDAHGGWEVVRFVVQSWRLDCPRDVHGNGKVESTFGFVREMFESVEVGRWELGITNLSRDRADVWVLLEWLGEEGGLVLRAHDRKKRVKRPDPKPEDDLLKLLPEGWVREREKCGDEYCGECYPVDVESGLSTDFPMKKTIGRKIGGSESNTAILAPRSITDNPHGTKSIMPLAWNRKRRKAVYGSAGSCHTISIKYRNPPTDKHSTASTIAFRFLSAQAAKKRLSRYSVEKILSMTWKTLLRWRINVPTKCLYILGALDPLDGDKLNAAADGLSGELNKLSGDVKG
ncbi:hypothetical protein BDW02DRAFT_579537 [Decorospora gaudefroyi]|uniref:F-box domain-containing protein n=1 Tax=Decorospora gaudefroyi TaxID=184978 RepID=A0A6A5KJA6_9PLEO|nr:hypothetical protein BDW02DRAFT_579537 [Decorospora gaudefroyi]